MASCRKPLLFLTLKHSQVLEACGWDTAIHRIVRTKQKCVLFLFLFQTSCTITKSWLVRHGLISTSAKLNQNMKENLRFYLKINCLTRRGCIKVTYGCGGRVQASAYQEVGGGEKNLDSHSAVFYCFGSLSVFSTSVGDQLYPSLWQQQEELDELTGAGKRLSFVQVNAVLQIHITGDSLQHPRDER